MALLRADLLALANLPATPIGRRLLVGTAIGLGLLATMTWWFAQAMVQRPQLFALVQRQGGDASLRGLLGYGLMACPLVATWLGLSLAQRQLFEGPEHVLWRSSPLPGWRGPLQVLLRAVFLSTCWATALAGPFLVALLQRSPAPAWAFLLLPVAIVGATAPLLAMLLAVQVVLVRLFAGRWLRLLLTVLAGLASIGFTTWLLLTMFAPGREQVQQLALRSSRPAPWTVDAGAALLAAAAGGVLDGTALRALLGWLGASVAGFALVAGLHPRAYERHLAAEPPLLRRRGRAWPAALAAVVRNKEFAQVLQQPGALVGFLVFAVLVFALTREQVLIGSLLADERLPRMVALVAVLLVQWFLAVMLVLYAHMGRLVLWDGAQWPLYTTSPAAPRALLRGKLTAVFVFLLWPLLLVAVAGAHQFEADGPVLAVFLGIALGGTLAALGVLAAVGTWPVLLRPDDNGQIQAGGRNLLGAIALVVTFHLVVALPGMLAWDWLLARALRRGPTRGEVLAAAPWVVAAALLLGALVAAAGLWIGARNYRWLLRPR